MVGVTGSIPVAPTSFAPTSCRSRACRRSRRLGRVFAFRRSAEKAGGPSVQDDDGITIMKVRNSLKSLRGRHRDNRIVRRKGRVYIINKTNRRFKARQG